MLCFLVALVGGGEGEPPNPFELLPEPFYLVGPVMGLSQFVLLAGVLLLVVSLLEQFSRPAWSSALADEFAAIDHSDDRTANEKHGDVLIRRCLSGDLSQFDDLERWIERQTTEEVA